MSVKDLGGAQSASVVTPEREPRALMMTRQDVLALLAALDAVRYQVHPLTNDQQILQVRLRALLRVA